MTTRRTCLQASSLLIPAGPLAHATQAGDLTGRPRSRIYRVRVDPISPLKADRHSLRLRYYFSIDVLRAAIQQAASMEDEEVARREYRRALLARGPASRGPWDDLRLLYWHSRFLQEGDVLVIYDSGAGPRKVAIVTSPWYVRATEEPVTGCRTVRTFWTSIQADVFDPAFMAAIPPRAVHDISDTACWLYTPALDALERVVGRALPAQTSGSGRLASVRLQDNPSQQVRHAQALQASR